MRQWLIFSEVFEKLPIFFDRNNGWMKCLLTVQYCFCIWKDPTILMPLTGTKLFIFSFMCQSLATIATVSISRHTLFSTPWCYSVTST